MKQAISLLLCVTGLLALSGCKWREIVFDFADPLPPPYSNYESGTYNQSLYVNFEIPRDHQNDFKEEEDKLPVHVYYTLEPDLPITERESWIDYSASEFHDIRVDRSMSLRAFSFSDETRFSEVKTFAWELKCPTPGFSQEPGPVAKLPAYIGIEIPTDQGNASAFSIFFTTDGSDPSSPDSARSYWTFFQENDPTITTDNVPGTPPFPLYEGSGSLTMRVVVQREGWSDSDIVTGVFTPTTLTASLDFTIGLPDGTVVSFSGQSPALRLNMDAMTVSALPSGMAKYEWSLNGMRVYVGSSATQPYQGSSLALGHLAASNDLHAIYGATDIDLSNLTVGSFTLSCISTDGNGYAYSNSISFTVLN